MPTQASYTLTCYKEALWEAQSEDTLQIMRTRCQLPHHSLDGFIVGRMASAVGTYIADFLLSFGIKRGQLQQSEPSCILSILRRH